MYTLLSPNRVLLISLTITEVTTPFSILLREALVRAPSLCYASGLATFMIYSQRLATEGRNQT